MDMTRIADDEGCFAEGYSDDMINRTFGRFSEAFGVTLICLWEYFDSWGYGGASDLYIINNNDTPHELAGTLRDWLNYNPTAGDERVTLSDPATWIGDIAPDIAHWQNLPGDGWHNYASENRE